MKIFKYLKDSWKHDKVLCCMEMIGYSIIIACNTYIITRPIPPAEVAAYFLFANLIGFLIGISIVKPVLLGTIFKKKFDKMIENIIKMAKNQPK
jgi:hypothetical protein